MKPDIEVKGERGLSIQLSGFQLEQSQAMVEPHQNTGNTGQEAGFWEGDNVFRFTLVQFEIPIKHVGNVQWLEL